MQFGKTLVGAIIGAALGIAVLIAVQHFGQTDKTWLAIVVALLTGLGVRAMVSTSGHASYLRGALTGILALAAYWGGTQLFTYLVTNGILQRQVAAALSQPAGEKEGEAGEGAEGEEAAPVEPVAVQPPVPVPGGGVFNRPRPQQEINYWDAAWLCIAALLAYELGRGTSTPAPKQEVVPPPDAT